MGSWIGAGETAQADVRMLEVAGWILEVMCCVDPTTLNDVDLPIGSHKVNGFYAIQEFHVEFFTCFCDIKEWYVPFHDGV